MSNEGISVFGWYFLGGGLDAAARSGEMEKDAGLL